MSLSQFQKHHKVNQLDKTFIKKYITSSMKSEEFEQAVFISTQHNGKNANVGYKTISESKFLKSSYSQSYVINSNYGMLTGFRSNITIVDIDFTNIKKHGNYDDNKFFNKFQLDMLNNFNTYTVNTPHNGRHFYFKYDNSIKQTQNINNTNVDIRNDGGYVVCPPSSINGKSYGVVCNKPIQKMPYELRDWIIKYQKKGAKTTTKKDKSTKEKVNKYTNETDYSCNIDNKTMYNILDKLPKKNKEGKSYVGDYDLWFLICQGCKWANCYEAFNKWSKTTTINNYNEEELNNIWSNSDCNIFSFAYILREAGVKNTFTYKNVNDTLDVHHEMNRGKVDKIKGTKRFFEDGKNYLLKSGTGTGKTSAFLKYMEDNPNKKFISVVSRVNLAYEQYENCKASGIKCEIYTDQTYKYGDNIIITPESSILIHNYDFSDYIIFMDEFNSIVEHVLSSSTLNNRRKSAFASVANMLSSCKQFIAVDADISRLSQSLLNYLHLKYKLYNNTFKTFKNKQATFYNDENDLLEKLKTESKFILCCDSKKTADVYFKLLDDDTIKLITSDTKEQIDSLTNYDKIIYSPKIIYGLDSQKLRPVYAVYHGQTITPAQMVQQLTRERQLTEINVFFPTSTSKMALFDDNEECDINQTELLNEFKESYDVSIDDYADMPTAVMASYEEIFNQLHTQYLYKMDCLTTNPKLHLISILNTRGFDINYEIQLTREETNKLSKDAKEQLKQEEIDNFNIEDDKHQKLNKILRIPEDKVEEYKDMFINQYSLQAHFNYSMFFFKDTSEIQERIRDVREFDIKKMSNSKSKVLFLDRLEKVLNIKDRDPESYNPTSEVFPNKNALDIMNTTYSSLFARSKSTAKTYNDLYKLYTKGIKNLCHEVGPTKKTQINKVRIPLQTVDKKIYDYHYQLFLLRKR